MSKEAPIICDYLPRQKTSSISIPPIGEESSSTPSGLVVKTYVRSWKEMKKQIRKDSGDRKKLDMDEVQINVEIDKVESENPCDFDTNTETMPFMELFYDLDAKFKESVMPDYVIMAMQDSVSSLSAQDNSGVALNGGDKMVRKDNLQKILNDETVPQRDVSKELFGKEGTMPQDVQSELGASISLEGKRKLTNEEEKVMKVIKDAAKEFKEEMINSSYIYPEKFYKN
jgi:hypothetical protein